MLGNYQQIQGQPTIALFLFDDMRIFKADNVTLAAGLATVTDSRITAADTICIYSRRTASGSSGAGMVATVSDGSVDFNANDAADAGTYSYILLNRI